MVTAIEVVETGAIEMAAATGLGSPISLSELVFKVDGTILAKIKQKIINYTSL